MIYTITYLNKGSGGLGFMVTKTQDLAEEKILSLLKQNIKPIVTKGGKVVKLRKPKMQLVYDLP